MNENHETAPARQIRRHTALSLTSAVAMLLGLSLALGACGAGPQPGTSAAQQLAFGVDMAERGLWGEALFRFQQAERLSPGDPQVLNNLAVAYEATGQFERALELYRSAIERAGGDTTLRQNYSRFSEFYATYRPDRDADEDTDEEAAGGAEGEIDEGAEEDEAEQGQEGQAATSEGQGRPLGDTSATSEESGESASEPSEVPQDEPSEDSAEDPTGDSTGDPTGDDR